MSLLISLGLKKFKPPPKAKIQTPEHKKRPRRPIVCKTFKRFAKAMESGPKCATQIVEMYGMKITTVRAMFQYYQKRGWVELDHEVQGTGGRPVKFWRLKNV